MECREPDSPLIRPDLLPPKISTRALIRGLNSLAHNNPRYRNGQIDEFQFTVSEIDHYPISEAVRQGWAAGQGLEPVEGAELYEVLTNDIVATYYFEAERISTGSGRIAHRYDFSVSAEQDNMQVPSHIARMVYPDLDAAEAVDAVGPVSLHRKLLFSISSIGRTLGTCDSYTFKDFDGDILSSVCGCGDESMHEAEYMPMEIVGVPDDPEEIDEDMLQMMEVAEFQRFDHEAIPIRTPEEALGLWVATSGLRAYQDELRQQEYDDNLLLALGTLGAMKRVLKDLAGVE